MIKENIKLDVFIEGELINLCIPTKEYVENSDWYTWLNNPSTVRYLINHGNYPNTKDKQLAFFNNLGSSRLVFIISDKNKYIGVISLSGIDLNRKDANLAMVLSENTNKKNLPYLALESVARMTVHAFDTMGLNRINSSQHEDLGGWQQRKELLGYRFEGIRRNKFIKGREVADIIMSSLVYEDYLKILKNREEYWDSLEKMKKRIKKLPQKKFLDKYNEFIEAEGDRYYEEVFKL